MHRRVELVDAVGGIGQFRDAEQRRLQSFAALAFQHLLLQHAIGFPQRRGAFLHALFEFRVRETALQRRLDMLGDVGQQRLVALVVACAFLVALHDHASDHLLATQKGHAQPAYAIGTGAEIGTADMGRDLFHRSHQWRALPDQIPGGPVLDFFHRLIEARIRRLGIGHIREICETNRVPLRVVQHDVEILRIHQAAHDVVQRAQGVVDVLVRACLVRDRVQGALQAFRLFQPFHGSGQGGALRELLQTQVDQPDRGAQQVVILRCRRRTRFDCASVLQGQPLDVLLVGRSRHFFRTDDPHLAAGQQPADQFRGGTLDRRGVLCRPQPPAQVQQAHGRSPGGPRRGKNGQMMNAAHVWRSKLLKVGAVYSWVTCTNHALWQRYFNAGKD